MAERGVDLAYGRTLPRLLREAGLVDVAADAYFPIGGPAVVALERATTEQIRDRLLAAGLATTRRSSSTWTTCRPGWSTSPPRR